MTNCQSNFQPYPIYTTVLTGKNLPVHLGYRPKMPEPVIEMLVNRPDTPPGTMKQKLTQTILRESEVQTEPYTADVVKGTYRGLEILTLGWLSWNNGLPAGINEIQTIERARQKRAWEAALPISFDKDSKDIREMIISLIEINEWNYREELIASITSLRLELAETLLKEKSRENKIKYEEKLYKYIQNKKEEKNLKLRKLKLNFNRQVRKLVFDRQKVNKKYNRWNVIMQFMDKTSEWYAPQMRFGEDPRHRHENINSKCGYWKAFQKLEIMHLTTANIPETIKPMFDFNKKSKPRDNRRSQCIRAKKWTEQNLETLHEELKNIRKRRYIAPRPCFLKKKVHAHEVEFETPSVRGISNEEEEIFQASLFLQKTIKGRAIQAVMFEGRVKCQELIEELKSTHALQNHMEDIKAETRRRIYRLQRQVEIEKIQKKRKHEILFALEGKTTGDMLDFLAKELLRLQDERKTHALALLADQERHKREAAEAGRRQVEEQRRREHDEMFKQVMKMHQNTVHAYLEDLMVENRHWLAHRQAREDVTKLAKKIDQAALETTTVPIFTRADDLQEEEIIADLIHNFALPEAEKRMVRQRLIDRQRNHLKICHDEVYSHIEKVVEGIRAPSGDLIPLPMVKKHRIPPMVRVKYLRLKRMHESSSSSLGSNSQQSVINEQFVKAHPSKVDVKQSIQSQSQQKELEQQKQEVADKQIWSSGFSQQDVILESEENDKTVN